MSPRDDLSPRPGPPDRPEPDPGRAEAEAAAAATWADAALAAALLAVDPVGLGGAAVRARPGPARDAWLAAFRDGLAPGAPVRRLPAGVEDDRLLGGLDLAAALAAGRPVWSRGLLAEADGGAVILPMAERAPPGLVARLSAALDTGEARAERDGRSLRDAARIAVVALDEGAEPDERTPEALADRLAFRLDLTALPRAALGAPAAEAEDLAEARERLAETEVPDDVAAALVSAADALGVPGLRAPLLALRAARAAAALLGADEAGEIEAQLAARLVLGPRATRRPAPPEAEAEEDAPEPAEPAPEADPGDPPEDRPAGDPPGGSEGEDAEATPPDETGAMDSRVLEAALAALPPDLLARMAAGRAPRGGGAGGAGAERTAPRTGRPAGARPGLPRGGARLDLVATLRTAAPWQTVRRREAARAAEAAAAENDGGAGGGAVAATSARGSTGADGSARAPADAGRLAAAGAGLAAAPDPKRLILRSSDFRIRRRLRRAESALIFLVDASGSAAAARLAEVKGAVELMLAEAYVRREQAALIAFRGAGAQLLLPPTRSLTAAKRRLAALPGGGGTPLAAGLEAGLTLADGLARRGVQPFLVLLTDGRANVDRAGMGGRAGARADAETAARALRAAGRPALVIDAAPSRRAGAGPSEPVAALAAAMGAPALALPRADAASLARAARAAADAALPPEAEPGARPGPAG